MSQHNTMSSGLRQLLQAYTSRRSPWGPPWWISPSHSGRTSLRLPGPAPARHDEAAARSVTGPADDGAGSWRLPSVSVAEWFSIEVFDGSSSARAWREAYGDAVVAAGHTEGLSDLSWHEFGWGVVLEVELPDEFAWDRLLAAPAVRAALDAVPDPVGGVLVHRGRGGSAGVRWPRRPRPLAGAGAVALPEPVEQEMFVFDAPQPTIL